MLKQVKLLCLTAAAACCIAGCSGQDDGVITLRMAQASAADGAIGLSMDKFAKEVNEKTQGRVQILTFHNGQLGNERENIESVQMGNLDMAVVNQSVMVNFLPDLAVFDLPYTIQSTAHADKVFMGPIGQDFLKRMSQVRLRGLAFWESGFRNLTNSVRAVNSADDVAGLRIRVMENKIHQDLWSALGADPVPMSWSDAYTGMQQGDPATPFVEISDRRQALYYALDHGLPGEIIAILGKGHETTLQRGNETLPFCEREILLDYMKHKKK